MDVLLRLFISMYCIKLMREKKWNKKSQDDGVISKAVSVKAPIISSGTEDLFTEVAPAESFWFLRFLK